MGRGIKENLLGLTESTRISNCPPLYAREARAQTRPFSGRLRAAFARPCQDRPDRERHRAQAGRPPSVAARNTKALAAERALHTSIAEAANCASCCLCSR